MRKLNPLLLFRNVLKSAKPGRLIGLDVGTTYIGVAVSDLKFLHASPYCVIMRNDVNAQEMALEIQHLITKLSALGLVVGYPYNRGRMNANATQVQRLTYDICKTNILESVDFTYWEEGFTSKLVECVMHPFKPGPEREKRSSDKLAAAGMLQGYLDVVNNAMRSDLQDSSDEDGELDETPHDRRTSL